MNILTSTKCGSSSTSAETLQVDWVEAVQLR